MPRRLVVLMAVLAAFLALILVVAIRRLPPDIPVDTDHRGAGRDANACLECHGPGQRNARKPNHPLGNDCWQCHFIIGEAR